MQKFSAVFCDQFLALRNPLLVDSHDVGYGTCACDLGGKLRSELCFFHRAREPLSLELLESTEQLLVHLHQGFKLPSTDLKDIPSGYRRDRFCVCHSSDLGPMLLRSRMSSERAGAINRRSCPAFGSKTSRFGRLDPARPALRYITPRDMVSSKPSSGESARSRAP